MYDARFDLNHDGKIDDADLDIFKSHFNEMAPYSSAEAAACDFDNSGTIDIDDYGHFAPHYGEISEKPKRNYAVLAILVILAFVGSKKHRSKV